MCLIQQFHYAKMAKKILQRLASAMDDMDHSDRVRILGIIDQFRALGINEDISLPQVCTI